MISVVIPTWNEAARLPALLAALNGEPPPHEIIVSDGGSPDGTAAVARRAGVDHVLVGPAGRGAQLRAGASIARGDTLLFLHADSRFSAGGLAAIATALAANPGAPGGNFRLRFDGDDRFSRRLERFYATIRRCGLYYGDSGIFIRRSAYDRVGGVHPLALMEDYDLVRRMQRLGRTLCIAEPPLVTSVRRFATRPTPLIVGDWVRLHALHWLGMSSKRLATMYDSARAR